MQQPVVTTERFSVFALAVLFAALSVAGLWLSPWFWIPVVPFAALAAVGVYDVTQRRHSILRNYPVMGHMRFIFEGIRPEIRQYLIESDQDEEPFTREERSLVYQRAKDQVAARPFGTKRHVYESGYAWLTHSIRPAHVDKDTFRVTIGGSQCARPYSASLYNISAMSFGALSGNAISALNHGAAQGGFAHDTGEGGISWAHRAGGGDLIWEIGSAYFGCRTEAGRFDPDLFQRQAREDQVKMVELKLSQGAKPGHGGLLPAAKITEEIARARGIPMGRDCVSPAGHPEFDTPIGMMEFLGRLRELSGGKPVGFKLCIGHRREFMCILRAIAETGIAPDFIVVDGKEGGTGAAPMEFANNVGMPLVEGLSFVHNALRGAGLRDRIRVGASGKLVHAFDIAKAFAIGADWANSARGFMFAVGCIQAQACHTNRCPVGVATTDKLRQRALVVPDKAERVARFHDNTMHALAELASAAGLSDPREFRPRHFLQREADRVMATGDEAWPYIPEGSMLRGEDDGLGYLQRWNRARADTFAPVD